MAGCVVASDGDTVAGDYDVGSSRVCVITEADRSATTILLPEEYLKRTGAETSRPGSSNRPRKG